MTHLHKEDYLVKTVSLDTCRIICEAHHYAHGAPKQAAYRHGLFRVSDPHTCVGVAHWLPPTRDAAMASWEGDWHQVLSLSRLAIHPDIPTNGASFLIGRSIRLIRAEGKYLCLVTYADTWQGHEGQIYRATNWEYLGLTEAKSTWVSSDGRMTSAYMGGKTRTRQQMEALGYREVGKHPKHKFRLILDPPKRPSGQLSLFEVAS